MNSFFGFFEMSKFKGSGHQLPAADHLTFQNA